jgi:DNA-binding transcriptional MocR family regulator
MERKLDRFPDSADPAVVLELIGDWSARPGPLYRRLAAALTDGVADGALVRGARLPAERQLAAALSVSRMTVVAAYDQLRSTGVVESRQGSGTRVVRRVDRPRGDGRVRGGRANSIFQRLVDHPDDTISLAQAVESAVPELRDALIEVVEADLTDLMADAGYHPRGLPALRAAIAGHLISLGLPTTADQVLVTTGAHQAIVLTAELYLSGGSTVVVETPSWPGCLDVFRARGATITGVPMDTEGIRPDLLANTLAEVVPDLVYLMPTFHNPTGTLTSAGRRRRVAELAAHHGIAVLEDNAYTAGTGQEPPPLAAFGLSGSEILSVGSLAKSVWAGLRIGWVRAESRIIERLARRKALADMGSPVLDQVVAARMLPRLAELTAARQKALRERRDRLEALLAERLPAWSWRRPDGGSALWIDTGADATAFAQVALRHGVEVVAGAAMDPDGHHDTHIRVPFTFPVPVLTDVVSRLERAWLEFDARS